MKAIDEWNHLIADLDNIYIYGAGSVAEKLRGLLLDSGKLDCLNGFIVTSKENNPSEINGTPVMLLADIEDKDATVLMSLSEAYHSELFQTLKDIGFQKIVPAHRFYSIDIKKTSDYFASIEDYIDKNIKLQRELLIYREKLIRKYFEYDHAFGGGGFYQSFPTLGIKGTRDTAKRIKQYKLHDYIQKESAVLDIGCNIGFLDMEISKNVKSILGIEYSDILVDLACETAQMIGLGNVEFISCDYNDWRKMNTLKFDVIFSFAVHGWINVEPEVYAKQIVSMLNDNGSFIIESQQFLTDKMFIPFVNAFLDKGLQIINENMINDDGETDRKFVVLQKK